MDMDKSPAAMQAPRRRPNHVVERKLGELDACLAAALSSRPRRSDVDGSLFAEIQARTDFLRTLIAAEGECHGGARLEHHAEAEARFAVLESAFDQWAQRGVAAPTEEEIKTEEEEVAASGSACSCTGSCFGFECTGQEVTRDAKCNAELEAVETHKAASVAVAAPTTTKKTTRRRWWWRRCAACCGAAGVVAVLALGFGVAIEFATVGHHDGYVVPT